jgi:hypothetical protein
VAKDPKSPNGGATRAGASGGRTPAGKGRTRPPVNVVTQQKPWGLIAAAVAVAVFAVAVLGYAVVSVNRSNADKVTDISQVADVKTYDYTSGQHVSTTVSYTESPPVGGPHDNEWADCTGTVYDVDIRHENAVHSLEHGAVWITYDPARVSGGDLDTLKKLVTGKQGMMMSPYAGLTSPVSLQSWNHQLFVDSVTDKRIQQYADFMVLNSTYTPEAGATCENPDFITNPLVVGDASRVGVADPTTSAPSDAPVRAPASC